MSKAPPVCRKCGKPLRPQYETIYVPIETPNLVGSMDLTTVRQRGRLLGYGYAGHGYFCSTLCGWAFAVRAFNRRKRKRSSNAGSRTVRR